MQTTFLDSLRVVLYVILIIVLFLLFQTWHIEHPDVTKEQSITTSSTYIPTVQQEEAKSANQKTITTAPVSSSTQPIHVTTDVMDVLIDTTGGNIHEVKLLNYSESLHSKTPFILFNNLPETRYISESGLLSTEGPDTKQNQALYSADQTTYILSKDQKTMDVSLHWKNANGLLITKTFSFSRGSYNIDVNYHIQNQSSAPWQGNAYFQLLRKNTPPATSGFMNLATYFGAAISSPEKPFEKITFKQMTESSLNKPIVDGWAAMIQHYFVSAWVPNKQWTSTYFSQVTQDGLYAIGFIGPTLNVPSNQTMDVSARLYAGPAIADQLEKAAKGLNLTIDYGWFWFLSVPIFKTMQWIYNLLGNWGWSIVIVTLIIKLFFYPLSSKSYYSMSKMKKLQPKIEALKERFAEDKQQFTKATLELYQKEKVNPVSGCLPILIQIPVFIALYWVLIESVQLRQAPFILWIHDLSIKDPYYILPVLMGISMFLQQRLNPPPADPVQAKVMLFMPVVFTLLFMNFPAGLMLYWFVNNTLSFMQQWYIMRSMERVEKRKKK